MIYERDGFKYDSETGIVEDSGGPLRGRTGGYLTATFKGKTVPAHRLIWWLVRGKFPKNSIDHINGIRDDNRLCNLRLATHADQAKNQGRRSDNTTGATGVVWFKDRRKWVARITVKGKNINLGYFKDFGEACATRRLAEDKYGFHNNHGSKRPPPKKSKKAVKRNNSSGVTGVSWINKSNRWDATIRIKGRNLYLGSYKDFSKACAARKNADQILESHKHQPEKAIDEIQKIIDEKKASTNPGVNYSEKRGKWSAKICVNGNHICLGDYIDFSDACAARKAAEEWYSATPIPTDPPPRFKDVKRDKYRNNKSGLAGVSFKEDENKWIAYISVNKKRINLGRFDDFFEACCARKSAENKYL